MDYYKVLSLSETASKEEIKNAFRKLVMKYHPDKHSHSPKYVRDSNTRQFKQVSEAYEVLVDDTKRAEYNLRRGYSAATGGTGGYGYGHSGSGNGYGGTGGYRHTEKHNSKKYEDAMKSQHGSGWGRWFPSRFWKSNE